MLDACLLARVIHRALPFRAAFGVIHVLECITEFFFLLGAVRTPPRAIHARTFGADALSKTVESAGIAVIEIVVRTPSCDQNHDYENDPAPAWARFLP